MCNLVKGGGRVAFGVKPFEHLRISVLLYGSNRTGDLLATVTPRINRMCSLLARHRNSVSRPLGLSAEVDEGFGPPFWTVGFDERAAP